MKALDIKVTGFKELDRLFAKLPDQVAKRVVDKALIKSAKPIVRAAKSKINVVTGNLKKSIGTTKGRARRFRKGDRTVLVSARTGGKFKGYLGYIAEFGTKERFNKAGKSSGKSPARPFLFPATRQQKNRQRKILIRQMAIGIHSEVNKLALKFGTRKR